MCYLNTEEASLLLNCSQKTVQRRIRNGELLPINPNHKTGYLFDKSYVENLVTSEQEGCDV